MKSVDDTCTNDFPKLLSRDSIDDMDWIIIIYNFLFNSKVEEILNNGQSLRLWQSIPSGLPQLFPQLLSRVSYVATFSRVTAENERGIRQQVEYR